MDYSLCLVTDPDLLPSGRTLPALVRAAVSGGVTCVQVRDKAASAQAYLERLLAVRPILWEHSIPLFVNDRIDLALAAEADGVHLGQADLPLVAARRIAGGRLRISISCESVEDAVAAERGGADYVSVSPVFPTLTKTDTAASLGLQGLRAIRAAVQLPVVAIGGITSANAAGVLRAGADGLCVVSAIVAAPDPRVAAAELRAIIGEVRRAA
jgi:thiamine-phosphate pyrophosphorylase